MQAQVKQWGNSQGIRISKEVLREAGIDINDVLDITISNGAIILSKEIKHKTLEERAAVYNGKLNLERDFEWGEAMGREKW